MGGGCGFSAAKQGALTPSQRSWAGTGKRHLPFAGRFVCRFLQFSWLLTSSNRLSSSSFFWEWSSSLERTTFLAVGGGYRERGPRRGLEGWAGPDRAGRGGGAGPGGRGLAVRDGMGLDGARRAWFTLGLQ